VQYEKSKQILKIMLTNWGRFHISVQFGKSFNKIDIEFWNSKYVAFHCVGISKTSNSVCLNMI